MKAFRDRAAAPFYKAAIGFAFVGVVTLAAPAYFSSGFSDLFEPQQRGLIGYVLGGLCLLTSGGLVGLGLIVSRRGRGTKR